MAMFNSYVTNYQRVVFFPNLWRLESHSYTHNQLRLALLQQVMDAQTKPNVRITIVNPQSTYNIPIITLWKTFTERTGKHHFIAG